MNKNEGRLLVGTFYAIFHDHPGPSTLYAGTSTTVLIPES